MSLCLPKCLQHHEHNSKLSWDGKSLHSFFLMNCAGFYFSVFGHTRVHEPLCCVFIFNREGRTEQQFQGAEACLRNLPAKCKLSDPTSLFQDQQGPGWWIPGKDVMMKRYTCVQGTGPALCAANTSLCPHLKQRAGPPFWTGAAWLCACQLSGFPVRSWMHIHSVSCRLQRFAAATSERGSVRGKR